MNIGNAIRLLRKQKGWTQEQLADYANTSKANISNLENDHQGYSPVLLKSLAQAFGCPISQLFIVAENLAHPSSNIDFQNLTPAQRDSLLALPIEVLATHIPAEMEQKIKAMMVELLLLYQ